MKWFECKMEGITDKMSAMNISSSIRVIAKSPDMLTKVFMSVSELCEDINILFDESGLSVSSMDSSHVCLVVVKFAAECFAEYAVMTPTRVGIKISNLVRVLKCVGDESIMFETIDDDFVVMTSSDRFILKTLDLDSEDMDIPDMDVDVEIIADSSEIQKHIKNIGMFGDVVEFATTGGDELVMKTAGDIGTVEMKIDQRVQIRGKLSASFATRYLVTFMKAANVSKEVIVKLSNDFPVVFEYNFASNSFIKFFLAPKIKDEEDGE